MIIISGSYFSIRGKVNLRKLGKKKTNMIYKQNYIDQNKLNSGIKTQSPSIYNKKELFIYHILFNMKFRNKPKGIIKQMVFVTNFND